MTCLNCPELWKGQIIVRPLTAREENLCRARALLEQYEAERRGAKDSVAEKEAAEDLRVAMLGATGEMAWSIYSWGEFPVRGDRHAADFRPDIEIRTTDVKNGRLILRERDVNDKANRRFVLIQVLPDRRFMFAGYVRPREVLDVPLTDPRGLHPARFVPQDDLHILGPPPESFHVSRHIPLSAERKGEGP